MAERDPEDLSQDSVEMDGDGSEAETEPSQAQNTGKACKFPCIRCKKNVTKAGGGVRCNTCYLWVHMKCQNISKELCSILSNPAKHGGCIFWFCDSCKASSQRLEAKMAILEKSCQEVENRMVRNEGIVQDVSKRVENVEKRQGKVEDIIEKEREKMRKERIEEMRERELRRRNVIIHRMPEAEGARTVEEKKDWDLSSCENMFRAVKVQLTRKDIKFCRRIGEKKEEARPMIVGFCRESHKEDILDKVQELRNTDFSEIGIVADLTQEQRKDEVEMAKEVDIRNGQRSEDEIAKNLVWRLVGRKGEKRLVRGVEREGEDYRRMEARREPGGLLPQGGRRGSWIPGGGEGRGRGVLRGRGGGWRGISAVEVATEREQLLETIRMTGATGTRPRLASKRLREGVLGEEEEEEERSHPPQPGLLQERF